MVEDTAGEVSSPRPLPSRGDNQPTAARILAGATDTALARLCLGKRRQGETCEGPRARPAHPALLSAPPGRRRAGRPALLRGGRVNLCARARTRGSLARKQRFGWAPAPVPEAGGYPCRPLSVRRSDPPGGRGRGRPPSPRRTREQAADCVGGASASGTGQGVVRAAAGPTRPRAGRWRLHSLIHSFCVPHSFCGAGRDGPRDWGRA